MADEKEKTLTVDATDLEAWAKEKGVAPEALAELRERIDAKEVDRNRGQFWKRIMKVLGFTALLGAGVGAGVYVAHEAVEAMPEAAALVAKRELGERGNLLKAKAGEVQQSAGILIDKVEAFMKAIPAASTNYPTLKAGGLAAFHVAKGTLSKLAAGKPITADESLHTMNEVLSHDPKLAPYWAAVSAAYDDLKKKGLELATMKGAFDVTETDKAQAWDDYKKVLWGNIQEDWEGQAKKLPTSAPAPESPK